MNRMCAACGKPTKGGIVMGSTLICRDCEPIISAEIESLRSEGKVINVRHIAMRHFREVCDPQKYLLNDIPGTLWTAAKHAADDAGINLRQLVLDALMQHPEVKRYL